MTPPARAGLASDPARLAAECGALNLSQGYPDFSAPPELYDLTELQRHANRLFGYTAQRTLEIAQRLYERRKLLSYPRTDSRHISRTIESTPLFVRSPRIIW